MGGLGHYGYGLGHYGYGLGYYGKRSAEAEPEAKADPYLLYGGYGLGYRGYGGYYGYGLGHGYYYGKRSAEAEPEAKADPYLLYGGYGYGHGLGYDTDMVSDTAATTGDRLPTSFRANLDHHQLTDVQKYSKLYQ